MPQLGDPPAQLSAAAVASEDEEDIDDFKRISPDELYKRFWRQKDKKNEYKRVIAMYEKKEREFVEQMELQMDLVEQQEKSMQMKINELENHTKVLERKLQGTEAENAKLKLWCESLTKEDKDAKANLESLTNNYADSEKRVQFLMDRLVSLLSSECGGTVEKDLLQTMHDREREHAQCIADLKSQLEQVRQQNRDFAVRLTEEQKLSAKLHSTLCESQAENFAGRLAHDAKRTSSGPAMEELPCKVQQFDRTKLAGSIVEEESQNKTKPRTSSIGNISSIADASKRTSVQMDTSLTQDVSTASSTLSTSRKPDPSDTSMSSEQNSSSFMNASRVQESNLQHHQQLPMSSDSNAVSAPQMNMVPSQQPSQPTGSALEQQVSTAPLQQTSAMPPQKIPSTGMNPSVSMPSACSSSPSRKAPGEQRPSVPSNPQQAQVSPQRPAGSPYQMEKANLSTQQALQQAGPAPPNFGSQQAGQTASASSTIGPYSTGSMLSTQYAAISSSVPAATRAVPEPNFQQNVAMQQGISREDVPSTGGCHPSSSSQAPTRPNSAGQVHRAMPDPVNDQHVGPAMNHVSSALNGFAPANNQMNNSNIAMNTNPSPNMLGGQHGGVGTRGKLTVGSIGFPPRGMAAAGRQTSAPPTQSSKPGESSSSTTKPVQASPLHSGAHPGGQGQPGGQHPGGQQHRNPGPNPNEMPNQTRESAQTQKEKTLEMERQLREVLDSVSFDRPVIRLGSGLYNFGKDACLLRLSDDNKVIASNDGGLTFAPIMQFLKRYIGSAAANDSVHSATARTVSAGSAAAGNAPPADANNFQQRGVPQQQPHPSIGNFQLGLRNSTTISRNSVPVSGGKLMRTNFGLQQNFLQQQANQANQASSVQGTDVSPKSSTSTDMFAKKRAWSPQPVVSLQWGSSGVRSQQRGSSCTPTCTSSSAGPAGGGSGSNTMAAENTDSNTNTPNIPSRSAAGTPYGITSGTPVLGLAGLPGNGLRGPPVTQPRLLLNIGSSTNRVYSSSPLRSGLMSTPQRKP